MALTEIIFGSARKKAAIGIVQLDASVSETHASEVELTSYPVEEGAEPTDHIRKLPESIEIQGLVSNTPITYLASAFGTAPFKDSTANSDDRVDDALSELKRAQDQGELLDVETTLQDFQNMVLQTMSVSRDAANGNVLNVTLSLREMLTAKSLSVDLPTPSDVFNKVKKNKGKVAKEAKEAGGKQEQKKSLLSAGLGALLGG